MSIRYDILYHGCFDRHGVLSLKVRVNLLDIFPNIEKINLMWLTDTEQGALDQTSTLDIIALR